MTAFFLLSSFGLVIALVAIVGGLWAFLKQQVVVDSTGAVTAIVIPFFGKLATNFPSLVAVFLGCALGAFVVYRVPAQMTQAPLVAKFTFDQVPDASYVIVGAVPQRYLRYLNDVSIGNKAEVNINVDSTDSVDDVYNVIALGPVDI